MKKNNRVTDPNMVTDPNITTRKKLLKKSKPKKISMTYPDWLNLELWAEFRKHRKVLKANMTDYVELLMLQKLRRLIDEGNNPDEVIKQSLVCGWKCFFPLRYQQDFFE